MDTCDLAPCPLRDGTNGGCRLSLAGGRAELLDLPFARPVTPEAAALSTSFPTVWSKPARPLRFRATSRCPQPPPRGFFAVCWLLWDEIPAILRGVLTPNGTVRKGGPLGLQGHEVEPPRWHRCREETPVELPGPLPRGGRQKLLCVNQTQVCLHHSLQTVRISTQSAVGVTTAGGMEGPGRWPNPTVCVITT